MEDNNNVVPRVISPVLKSDSSDEEEATLPMDSTDEFSKKSTCMNNPGTFGRSINPGNPV